MSTLLRAAALLLTAASLGACSSGDAGTVGNASMLSPAPSPAPSGAPSQAPRDGTAAGTACEEVAAGIGAFNAGDLDETVASFERALPLAEAEDAEADSRASADLLEAVRYYAELAPQDYPEASLSSPDFARYKAITLGQCLSSQPPAPQDDGGIPA